MAKAFLLRKEELEIIISSLETMNAIEAWNKESEGTANELLADLRDELKHYDDTEEDIKKRFGIN